MTSTPQSIYLAGPTRGLSDFNYPRFDEAESVARMRFSSARIFNPARCFDGDTTLDIRDYFAADFGFLLSEADGILFLPGWQASEGALIEYAIARALGLRFGFFGLCNELLDLGEPVFRSAEKWPDHAPVAYEAHKIVFTDRGPQYGHPAANFNDIAAAWNAQLGTNRIDALEVANMMTSFKIARGKHSYKRDNIIDAIGYQVAAQRVVDGQ